MNLEPYVAISGAPGVFKLKTPRSNGLVVEEIDTGKVKFFATRKHQFTPLGTVAIYTLEDSTELKVIFNTMLEQMADNPPASVKSPNHEIFEYFEKILPNFDEDRVYISDIKKVIKWFTFLNERNLLEASDEEE
jgi:hypothetical protein